MEPRIYSKGPLIIAGVTGSGNETAGVWEAFMKLEKISPLRNTVEEAGYEIRMYSGEDTPGEVHTGMNVKDTSVPPGYQIVTLPASMYAEFEIYPVKGYGSRNQEIEKWLSDNDSTYRQRYFNGKETILEVYDSRFKGNKDPDSIVGILVPIEPV